MPAASAASPVKLQAFADNLDTLPPVAEIRLVAIVDFITKPIDDLIHEAGGIDPFCLKIRELYDRYISPVDVPWVPNVLEPAVIDTPAKALIEAVIRRFHEAIHKVPVVLP